MQPIGSGINVWLNEKILEILGDEEGRTLIAEAAQHGAKRYEWLCDRLMERGHTEIVKEWPRKKREDAAQSRIANKQRELMQWRARLAETDNEQLRSWYLQRIAKCEQYLAARQ